ncbi:glycosyltransferase family 31 protein [Lepidopterella palustris CBS 459.81]|uniref:N-acetylgalactosaminide beta-1,3-galactosyltransferase n=1 Tax=Lepidopterella palustris CBS 459.81 TaxID=1314670 RepID=A0A8E2E8Q9_9PEZI|nr:glycosyltransferase family 31 protein [Lepidopterella palustris CBS 459.81]
MSPDSTDLPCLSLPGADNVLVVLKTSVTEALDKLPIHFDTILRCVPHYIVYSDFRQDIAGHHVYDALDELDDEIKRTNPDFELYNRLQQLGQYAIEPTNPTSIIHGDAGSSGSGYANNPGWKLDKWKTLPLVDKALRIKPDAEWYIFMEADTYLVWPNLLEWLTQFNSSEPHYIGSQMRTGDVLFGHGGSGYIISNPAIRKVSAHRAARLAEYNELTAGHLAGDCVLGKAMGDVDVPLLWSWPILQASRPLSLDYAAENWGERLWCRPVVSYHTVSSGDIESFWQFERRWFSEASSLLRHSDVFKHFVLPQIRSESEAWDKLSRDDSFDRCRAVCESKTDCMQFSYTRERCYISKSMKLGYLASAHPDGMRSGWMMERIEAFVKSMDMNECKEKDWIV